ncbi:MAG: hypothetical protein AAF658_14905, partial [Myxococcota bacterium]
FLRLDVLFGPMFDDGEGEAAVQISQRGLREAIIKGPATASIFRNVVVEMHGKLDLPYMRPSRGPFPAAFDPSTLLLAASGDVATFERHFGHLDIHYMRDLIRQVVSDERYPRRRDARDVIELMRSEGHGALDPRNESLVDAVLHDLRMMRMSTLIINSWDADRSTDDDLRREFSRLGGGRFSKVVELERRAHELFELTLSDLFSEARAQLLADSQAEPTLEQVEALMEEGFRAVAALGRPGSSALGSRDFFAFAHWVSVARAAGTHNVLGMIDFETDDGLVIRAGDPILDDPNLDHLMDGLAAQIRAETAE